MKNIRTNLLLVSTVMLMGACASNPKSTTLLDQVRVDYVRAQSNPKIATYAALEMQSATEANAAAKEREPETVVTGLPAGHKIALQKSPAKSSEAECQRVDHPRPGA
jgi:hypothetical protein